jgi:phosphatidylserine decarboxylase
MTIHKEGKASLALAAAVGLALFYSAKLYAPVLLWPAMAVSVAIIAFLMYFFRKPCRKIVVKDGYVLAPADGKVVVIEEVVEDEYFKGKRLQVSIFMSPFNVHVNYYPVAGKVSFSKYHPGKHLVAWHPKSSTENERTTVVVDTPKAQVLMRQIAGALARRIVCYAKEGDVAEQGCEYGFIKLGSRVDLFLPLGTEVQVQLGQKVTGSQTVIAKLPN